jgi:peroxiredoxin
MGTSSLAGQPAARFDLADIEGQRHRLSDSAGHWLILLFHRHLG